MNGAGRWLLSWADGHALYSGRQAKLNGSQVCCAAQSCGPLQRQYELNQHVCEPGHEVLVQPHTPVSRPEAAMFEQNESDEQANPHPPQCARLVETSTQAPAQQVGVPMVAPRQVRPSQSESAQSVRRSPSLSAPSAQLVSGAPPSAPASGSPASGSPASGDPASGNPASGGPASGGPASGGPASAADTPASGGPASDTPPSPTAQAGRTVSVLTIEPPITVVVIPVAAARLEPLRRATRSQTYTRPLLALPPITKLPFTRGLAAVAGHRRVTGDADLSLAAEAGRALRGGRAPVAPVERVTHAGARRHQRHPDEQQQATHGKPRSGSRTKKKTSALVTAKTPAAANRPFAPPASSRCRWASATACTCVSAVT